MKKCKCIISSVIIEKELVEEQIRIKLTAVEGFYIKLYDKEWNLFVDEKELHQDESKELDNSNILQASLIETSKEFKISNSCSKYVLEAYNTKKPVYVYINSENDNFEVLKLELL